MTLTKTHLANIVDIPNRTIYPVEITVSNGVIDSIHKTDKKAVNYILPGFVDAHIHIESAMLVPVTFARMAVIHGTVATVSDPHEIANIMGIEGVRFMIENSRLVNFKFFFGAPSCVPATSFETAGGTISVAEIRQLLQQKEIKYLSEMMNWPGVLDGNAEVMEKISIAKENNKPVDGHAPGLRGEQAKQYIAAGISTDHECFTLEEALEKLEYGMKIIIREGSAAKNFEALYPLIDQFPDKIMLCSDDKHPDDLTEGHINQLVKRAIAKGLNLFNVLQAACINPINHYNLAVGRLQIGDPADFIIVRDLQNFEVLQTYVQGALVAEEGRTKIPYIKSEPINNFNCSLKTADDFKLPAQGKENISVIVPADGQLVTSKIIEKAKVQDGSVISNIAEDTLKLTVVNRYGNTRPAIAFIKKFGLKRGAIASCVAHDSHNIIAVGTDDEAICQAVNTIIKQKGGICAIDGQDIVSLPLSVAGIMSVEDGPVVADLYMQADKMAKAMGSSLKAPFMTLSFMALLVIPSLKLSDKGLFDGTVFEFTDVLT